jgi:predicted GNAT superfamily acetyltransferase
VAASKEGATDITVRALETPEDYRGCVRLQQEIWGFSEEDSLPVRLFIVARKIGGQIFGAFDKEALVGFCVALPGIDRAGGGHYLHSNMLGVQDKYRDHGLGRRLKHAQRDDAMARGIDLIEWTFDPFELKNAYFNMERLGAVVQRYVLNQYGITSSALHGGLPTDRSICEWFLSSDRATAAAEGKPVPRPPIEERIDIRGDFADLKRLDPPRAREVQKQVSEAFLDAFRRGLTVVGVEKTTAGGQYLLGKWKP